MARGGSTASALGVGVASAPHHLPRRGVRPTLAAGGDEAAAPFRRPPIRMRTASPGDVVSPDDLLAQIRRRFPDLVLTTTWGARSLRYHSGDALGHGVDFVTVEERDRSVCWDLSQRYGAQENAQRRGCPH